MVFSINTKDISYKQSLQYSYNKKRTPTLSSTRVWGRKIVVAKAETKVAINYNKKMIEWAIFCCCLRILHCIKSRYFLLQKRQKKRSEKSSRWWFRWMMKEEMNQVKLRDRGCRGVRFPEERKHYYFFQIVKLVLNCLLCQNWN